MTDKMDDFEKQLPEQETNPAPEPFHLKEIDFDEAYEHHTDLSEEEKVKNK